MGSEVIIGKYRIDGAQMVAYEYTCEPEKCEERNEYCCARFEVDISRTEMERMTGLMPASSRYAPTLMEGAAPRNVFDEFDDDPRRFVIDKNDAGDCVFTFVASGEKRCALHSACVDLSMDPMVVKPLPCRIWPLTIGDRDPDGKIHVGFDLASDPVCLTKKRRDKKTVSPGVRELLTGLLGKRAEGAIRAIEQVCA